MPSPISRILIITSTLWMLSLSAFKEEKSDVKEIKEIKTLAEQEKGHTSQK
jgi:hypothetical protein